MGIAPAIRSHRLEARAVRRCRREQYREQERRDKADTPVVQAAGRRMRAELRKDE